MVEKVVLVDDENRVQGTAPKQGFHDDETPLHRGFSVYVFDDEHGLLLQQRSSKKTTWPGYWSNSVCGHPELDESVVQAARRRARQELSLQLTRLSVVLPDYQYTFENNGVVENEICPVLVAQPKSDLSPNPAEVQDTAWAAWQEVQAFDDEDTYTPWFLDEVTELKQSDQFNAWLEEVTT